jgi:hypothetical protein
MTTDWKQLTRKDLTTFDDFATEAVLSAMHNGGVGRIAPSGHAKIRGKNGVAITISRDSSAPHCRGNVTAALKRAFPELNKPSTSEEEAIMATETPTQLQCPAKGCDQTFADADMLGSHIDTEHYVCGWEGCADGLDGGPFIARTKQSKAGHININHRGHKPWLVNTDKAAAGRAAAVAARRERAANAAANAETLMAAAAAAAANTAAKAAIKAESNGHAPTAKLVQEEVAVPVETDADAKLSLIREILGDDVEVAALKKEIADLKAHLALVREAVGLDFGTDDE